MNNLESKELKELLIKGWMTHDGMWFYHSMQEFGIERTNKVNREAVKAMSAIEVKRLKKILGVESVRDFNEFKEFVTSAYELVMADFMKLGYQYKEPNVLEVWWEPESCFAYQGIKQIGAIEDYQCGIFDRSETWYRELGLNFTVTPKVSSCMMHTEGKCFRRYEFDFGSQ
ncbi:MAG: hypothetical protein JW984_15445 [Deltaproteobacteria bacterium]|uniref:L-2-amino-thiazoline-4-carboxylic acid hydrolase n=1 Tax=Candidatus Zymogenus saltonus TaxID=2844893 RepID=A0A9D8PP39_9DELT|nr:hypothetical protein [Candidatus Zymogenus saltonus]